MLWFKILEELGMKIKMLYSFVNNKHYLCIPMADSCWGLTGNSKILYGNFPSMENKLKKKSKHHQEKIFGGCTMKHGGS